MCVCVCVCVCVCMCVCVCVCVCGHLCYQMPLLHDAVLIFFLGFAAYGISSFQFNLSLRCVHFERVVPSCASSDFGPWAVRRIDIKSAFALHLVEITCC